MIHIDQERKNNFDHRKLEGSWLFRKFVTIGWLGDLYQAAYFDDQTCLPNKRYWNRIAPRMYEEVVNKHSGEMSVVFMDFDDMKIINALLGHLNTDCLMASAGKLLEVQALGLRHRHDLVTRWGADEFAMALPYTSIDQAQGIAVRFTSSLKTLEQKHIISPAVTIGIASSRQGFENFHELQRAADDIMMLAKESIHTKGRIHVFSPRT